MTSRTRGPSVAAASRPSDELADPGRSAARVDKDLDGGRDVSGLASDRDDACDLTQRRLETVAVPEGEAECDGAQVMSVAEQLLVVGSLGDGVDPRRAAERDVALPPDRQRSSASVEDVGHVVTVDDGDGLLEGEILGEAGQARVDEARSRFGPSELVGEELQSGDRRLLC